MSLLNKRFNISMRMSPLTVQMINFVQQQVLWFFQDLFILFVCCKRNKRCNINELLRILYGKMTCYKTQPREKKNKIIDKIISHLFVLWLQNWFFLLFLSARKQEWSNRNNFILASKSKWGKCFWSLKN